MPTETKATTGSRPRHVQTRRDAANSIMPLDPRLDSEDVGLLYDELYRRVLYWSPHTDFFFYNVGTGISLGASGLAVVLATVNPLIAALLSAVSAFFLAMTRILRFDSRWKNCLARREVYTDLIIGLNAAASLTPEIRAKAVEQIWTSLRQEGLRDPDIPGITEAAQDRPSQQLRIAE